MAVMEIATRRILADVPGWSVVTDDRATGEILERADDDTSAPTRETAPISPSSISHMPKFVGETGPTRAPARGATAPAITNNQGG